MDAVALQNETGLQPSVNLSSTIRPAFRTVYDLTLEDGRIVELRDRSKEIEEKRGAFNKRYESFQSLESLAGNIAEAFSQDMDLE